MLARALPKSYISMYDQIGENERSALRHCNLLVNWIIIKKEMWRSGPLFAQHWTVIIRAWLWTVNGFHTMSFTNLISNLISNHLPLLRRKQYRPGQWLPHPRITVCLSSIPLQVIMAQRRDLWPRVFQFQRIPSSVPSTVPTTTRPQCSSASLAMVAIAAVIATADAIITIIIIPVGRAYHIPRSQKTPCVSTINPWYLWWKICNRGTVGSSSWCLYGHNNQSLKSLE